MAVFAVLVGFSSATQDIAIDAWRIEAAEISRQGAMAAAYQWGYRIAMLVAGAVPLLLAEAYGWNLSYAVMAALMTVGVVAVLAAPREEHHAIRPIHADGILPAPVRDFLEWAARLAILALGALLLGSGLTANAGALARRAERPGRDRHARRRALGLGVGRHASGSTLLAVVSGFSVIVSCDACRFLALARGRASFCRRRSAIRCGISSRATVPQAALILALICLYRLPDFVLNIMNPFYIDLGFTLVEIAEVRKIFGVVMTMLGVLAAVLQWRGSGACARW